MPDERRMLSDDEVEKICHGMRDYLFSLGRDPAVASSEVFESGLLLYARKYGYVDGPTARQMTNLTDADKAAITQYWDDNKEISRAVE